MNKTDSFADYCKDSANRAAIIGLLILWVLCFGGCAIEVEPLSDAPVSHYNPEDDTAERMYGTVAHEHAETNEEMEKDWDAGGKPLPKGGWDPFDPYD